MPNDKRERLTAAATELGHRIGLANASIAAIAERADVPTGNVYYYFKTKDDLTAAVIDARRRQYAQLRDLWDSTSDDPIDCLVAFVRHTRDGADELVAHGCPIGGLCRDLVATDSTLAADAGRIFGDTIEWCAGHYRAAGTPPAGADDEARRLVAIMQGVTVLAHTSGDADMLRSEAERVELELRKSGGTASRSTPR